MVQKRGAFNLRVSEEPDPTIGANFRKFVCEIFLATDENFENRLDKIWVTVKRTENGALDEVDAFLLFFEYVEKFCSDLLRQAEAPLENVMEDAFERSFGWSFGEASPDGFDENLRKSLSENLGLF